MSDPIHICYTWDKETFLKASHIAYTYELKHSPKRFLGWIFIAMTQFGVVSAMRGGAIGLLMLSSLLVIYWYYFRWQIRKVMLAKSFDTLPQANEQYHITATEEGLVMKQREITWQDILEIVSLPEGFLVYFDQSFIFFPLSAFISIEEKNRFASLARENVKHYHRG